MTNDECFKYFSNNRQNTFTIIEECRTISCRKTKTEDETTFVLQGQPINYVMTSRIASKGLTDRGQEAMCKNAPVLQRSGFSRRFATLIEKS
jgi:hypothetical protein